MANNPKVRASGPLWANTDKHGFLSYLSLHDRSGGSATSIPCRLLPGHGRWVPLELVEAIWKAWSEADKPMALDDCMKLRDAIEAAMEGEV